jgi:acyl-CoA reductase-like NAD-dependent aldehyde dehydrogenase
MRIEGRLVDTSSARATATHDVISPVTGRVLATVDLATKWDLAEVLKRLSGPAALLPSSEVFAFLERLKDQMVEGREVLLEKTMLETGFIASDSAEIVDGAIGFLSDFEAYVRGQIDRRQVIRHSYSTGCDRDMLITDRPYRCAAAVVPQNASLTLAITIIASALYAGCRVLVRPSLQCAVSGSLLARMIEKSRPPVSHVAVVNCLANDLVEACCESPDLDLIHYIGSNEHALSVFQRAFAVGKICLLDGQGNGLLYLDDSFPLDEAVRIITSGATRFNGETCTSINGALIQDSVYGAVREALVEAFREIRVGHPAEPGSQIGPLFSERQAERLRRSLLEAPGARLLCGGQVDGAYFAPAVIEGVGPGDRIAREGFFGPALWIRSVRDDSIWDWLRDNRFPLSDTVLSRRRGIIQAVAARSRAARICVNADPSVESMFEPWGGYPPSGLNPVSVWTEKYRQTFQLDGALRDIIAIPSELQIRPS